MTDNAPSRRSGGREGRRAARLHAHVERTPFLTRTFAPFEVLDEEGLSLIEQNADTILEEVGVEFRGDPDALRLLREAGADVDGERVRFPRGMCRRIVQASAPRQFTQYARNEANNVEIGGMHTVFAPNYGSPFVRDLDRGRRYGTIEDFQNLVKLTYLSPHLHHSGGTVCEPVDIPVNKRHLDMVYAHMRYSDKPFMGSVTAPERARDTVEMARILFGAEFLEDHAVILSLINANSPLVWDATMLGSARAYAEANQATLLTPFILAGAMAPVTAAGVAAQTLAEALAGMTFVQLVRPGAPVVLGSRQCNKGGRVLRRQQSSGAWWRNVLVGMASAAVVLGSSSVWLGQAVAQEKLLHEGPLSGGRIQIVIELAPVDRLTPGVLNGVLNTGDSNGNGIPDHVENAHAHLEAQIRYARGEPNAGARVAQEFVPFLRVTAFITNTTTAITIAVPLLPHLGVAEGWHYASNVRFQGDPLLDTYTILLRIDPPTGLAKHSDFAGAGEAGTLYSGRTEITLTGISNIDINNPDSIGDPTTVLVEENLSPGS